MKVISLWSGGKDCSLALDLAKSQGHHIVSLCNFMDSSGANSLSHGLSAQLIQNQAALIGVPLIQKMMPKESFRDKFCGLVLELKKTYGIEGIVFGDIYLQEHRDWIDKVCAELKVTPIIPLWDKDVAELINEFIKKGFKAIIVSTRSDMLGSEWLGREINTKFVSEINAKGNIDLCGEKGEFHTFVYDGPCFKNPLQFSFGNKALKGNRWYLEVFS